MNQLEISVSVLTYSWPTVRGAGVFTLIRPYVARQLFVGVL